MPSRLPVLAAPPCSDCKAECRRAFMLQYFDDEDDWLVHEDEEEGGGGAAAGQRRRRRRAALADMPDIDPDALAVGASDCRFCAFCRDLFLWLMYGACVLLAESPQIKIAFGTRSCPQPCSASVTRLRHFRFLHALPAQPPARLLSMLCRRPTTYLAMWTTCWRCTRSGAQRVAAPRGSWRRRMSWRMRMSWGMRPPRLGAWHG